MNRLARAHLISALVATIALTSQPASALPSAVDPTAAPRRAPAASGADQPLIAAVPPANDELANAEVVGSLPFATTTSTLEATTAPDDPSCWGNSASVWYAYTPVISTMVVADTFGSDYDTTLSAYTGSPGSLAEVACNDDSGGPQSQIAFPATAGTTYYLLAAGRTGGGNLELSLDVDPPLAQIPVRTTSYWEITPAVGSGIAWAQARRGDRHWTLYLKLHGEPRVRVNDFRSSGLGGGWDNRDLVYQEIERGRSNLRLYNTDSRRSSTPRGVNTRHWEWHPTMTEEWLLFGRRNFRARTDVVVLQNRATRKSVVLDRVSRIGDRRFLEAGQVAGDYAVWYRCTPRCDVFLRDIGARTTTRIPNPQARQQYDPGVAEDGTVYFVQSGRGCGTSVEIFRRPLGGPTTSLVDFPDGRDAFDTQVVDHGDGTASVYFSRVRCSPAQADIYKLIDP